MTNVQKSRFTKKLSLTTKAISFVLLASYGTLSHGEVLNSQTPITPQDMVKLMKAGVDSTWSEVPNKIEDYTAVATVEFADKGFKHIRLRIANDSPTAVFTFLDEQIQDALDNGMIPIIANQSHTFEDNPTESTQAAWVQWWEDIAVHYKDYPYELMFDLIVEIAASSPLSDEPINQLNEAYEQAVTAIRGTGGKNDERIVIFSAHKRSDPTRMDQLDIPTAGNDYLIGEFHEGYASGPSTDPTNPHYYWDGGAAEITLMTERADAAVAWSVDTGIPIWEGAWMAGNYNKGDDYDNARQIAFVKDFVGVLNDRNIPHAVNATKKFYDVSINEWTTLEPVADAIIALVPADIVEQIIFSDDFESGTLSDWAVSGVSGDATLSSAFEGSYGAKLTNTSRMKTTISTAAYSAATLSFSVKTNGLDSGESLKAEYSIDGGSLFITLGETTVSEWEDYSFTLPSDALGLDNLVIKLVLKANKNSENAYIDNVIITGE
ncbi:cellulase family glycosylhydrolase [Colwellia psychrerythraea]|uniref:Glycosyl hydrolase, family 5 n=1 Tax=Colwellia psychrerythraea (strain 34H / ATCC BAA-681) TaxID=167879 RepID=Q482D8_COLP3|nr:cellulase family glycosylhydrolase [Colwellia psychrerythraea]AAZ27892.1 glycosyl hydrolase, family 5 [Colwellia psychrerythraea 34H]